MRKVLFSLVLISALAACGNDKMTTETDAGTPNVQNVNGNIPDTSNSISPDNSSLVQDSSLIKAPDTTMPHHH